MGKELCRDGLEIAVLRVAHVTKANYEWVQHVAVAKGVGITQEEIDLIGVDGDRVSVDLRAGYPIDGIREATAARIGAALEHGRRQHRLQRAGVVAPGVELLGADADPGLEHGKPGCEHFRRRSRTAKAEAFGSVTHRPMRGRPGRRTGRFDGSRRPRSRSGAVPGPPPPAACRASAASLLSSASPRVTTW